MNIHNVKLLISAGSKTQFPESTLPEVVMLGRSNVGKSSLINRLLLRSNFARTSSMPGKTATVNFYELDRKLMLVDLPGYGYAKVSKEEKKRWAALIESYLSAERPFCLFLQLVDARHAPSADDEQMVAWLRELGQPFLVVATKVDKPKPREWAQNAQRIIDTLDITPEQLLPFSAQTGLGREELLGILTMAMQTAMNNIKNEDEGEDIQ